MKVAASITGAIWFVKGQGDYLKEIVMTVDTKAEKLITDFPGQDKRFIFQLSKLVMQRVDGTTIQIQHSAHIETGREGLLTQLRAFLQR